MATRGATQRYVALLRGINVGKAKRVAMADLRALLQGLGCTDVRTLLNSGNAVFSAPAQPPAALARRIEAALLATLGVQAAVVVKTAADLAAVVAGNPLGAVATDPSRLVVAFTADAAGLRALRTLAEGDWGDEVLHVGEHAAYLWCANGILESKLAVALLRGLGATGTTRNWGTVQKINAMLLEA